MSNSSKLEDLRQAWDELSEAHRTQVFKSVARVGKTYFTRLSKKMHGFTPKGLAARPAPIVSKLDVSGQVKFPSSWAG